jgi:hypothetical protein
MVKTRKDAQQEAAESALHSLAGKILLLFVLQGRLPDFDFMLRKLCKNDLF